MNLDEHFTFGKYKGLTLSQVYQGTQSINGDLLKAFIESRILEVNKTNPKSHFTSEVSDSLIRINSVALNSIIFDLTDILNDFFMDRKEIKYLGYMSLDDLNSQTANEGVSSPIVVGVQPEYINWCIQNIPHFYVEQGYIEHLQSLPVCRFRGIKVNRKIDDICEYVSVIETQKYDFNESTLEKNEENCEKENRYLDNFYREADDYYDDAFESSCACGESPCMCSDPDPG